MKAYEKNARTHSSRQIRQIARSIETFAFVNPALIDCNRRRLLSVRLTSGPTLANVMMVYFGSTRHVLMRRPGIEDSNWRISASRSRRSRPSERHKKAPVSATLACMADNAKPEPVPFPIEVTVNGVRVTVTLMLKPGTAVTVDQTKTTTEPKLPNSETSRR